VAQQRSHDAFSKGSQIDGQPAYVTRFVSGETSQLPVFFPNKHGALCTVCDPLAVVRKRHK
jgi:hypothetical protein